MEARSIVRNIQMSPRKLRVVASMIRGESVERAMTTMALAPKKGARILEKAITSATANIEDKFKDKVDTDNLFIKTIYVDGGRLLKRWRPRSMGRSNRIHHRSSHLTIVVSDSRK